MFRTLFVSAAFLGLFAAMSAANAQSVSEKQCDFKDLLQGFESKGGGGYAADNKRGYIGKYQFGLGALQDTGYKDASGNWTGKDGVTSADAWKANAAAQESAMDVFAGKMTSTLKGLGAESYVGQTMGGCSAPLTMTGMMMGAHLTGPGGAADYLKSGGFCGKKGQVAPSGYTLKYNTTDGNNTCTGKYICAGSGCQDIQKDTSKETCNVVMPMIEAISCSKMPPNLQGFCNTYRPYLMTRPECSSAESMSKAAKMGPNKEQCENLSFGVGTGSWSFVLACSYAGDFVADQDGKANPNGPVSDPQCIQKLQAAGIEHKVLGQVVNGSASGKTCVIENAVQVKGTAVPYGGWRTVTCDMALAMNEFDKKMAAIGVTGYTDVQTTVPCRPMRDKTGNKAGTVSEHGLGRAADIPGFIVGGRKISFGAIHAPNTPDGILAMQAKGIACSTFRGVLSPTYKGYVGAYVHFHVEWGSFNGCR